MDRELKTCTQHTGGTGGIVQAKLQQGGPTHDIGRLEGKSGELAAYRVFGLYDPHDTWHRAAPRWIMRSAAEKLAGRPSPPSAAPLCRRPRTAKSSFPPVEIDATLCNVIEEP